MPEPLYEGLKELPNTDTHNCFACSPVNAYGLARPAFGSYFPAGFGPFSFRNMPLQTAVGGFAPPAQPQPKCDNLQSITAWCEGVTKETYGSVDYHSKFFTDDFSMRLLMPGFPEVNGAAEWIGFAGPFYEAMDSEKIVVVDGFATDTHATMHWKWDLVIGDASYVMEGITNCKMIGCKM